MNIAGRANTIRPIQAAWLSLAIAIAVAWTAAFLQQWDAFQTACHPVSTCNSFQLDTNSARVLAQHGFSLEEFAVASSVVGAIAWAIWVGLGALIIWRRPEDRGAALSAFFLLLGIATSVFFFVPGYEFLSSFIGFPVILLLGLLFPDGRFVPNWTRWPGLMLILVIAIGAVPSSLPIVVSAVPLLATPIIAIWAQTYRYRRVSSWEQRQQTKWAALGIFVGMLGFIALAIPYVLTPQITGYGTIYDGIVNVTGTSVVLTAIPIFIAVAILRSRLWNIDYLINRALVYGSLTVSLAALYTGTVLALQHALQLAGTGGSNLAVAISTLVTAALFNPLRRYIQSGIDRRFYRRKYDSVRTLAGFSARVRDEVDLTELSTDVIDVVQDVLQPAHVSLWLADGQLGRDS